MVQSEAEKLQRLKERVDTQEAKLKKIRAMRGQVDYSKLINGNLCKSAPRELHNQQDSAYIYICILYMYTGYVPVYIGTS